MAGPMVKTRSRALMEHAAAAAPTSRRAAAGAAAAVLALQRSAGNRAVCGLLRCKDKKKRPTAGQMRAAQMAVKAAPNQTQYQFATLSADVQNSIQQILAGNETPYLRPNKGKHSTDPETGMPKKQGIGVREFHTLPYSESKRVVTRSEGGTKTVYYDGSHVAGTYTYHRVNGAPFPAAAPAPAPVPALAVPAPAAPAPVLVPAAAPQDEPVDDWEKL